MNQHAISIVKRANNTLTKNSSQELLKLYKHLHPSQTSSLLPSLIKSCSSPPSLSLLLQLHCSILKSWLSLDPVIMNSLLTTYSKHSLFDAARLVFDTMPVRDVVSWNSMINCCIANGHLPESVELFQEMHFSGMEAKPELVASVLSVCGRMGHLRHGKEIYARAVRNPEHGSCVLLSTSLVDMFCKCGDLDSGLSVFDSMCERNEVSWTAMITGCVFNGDSASAFDVFRGMVGEGIKPNRATLVSILPACGEFGYLHHGKEVHGYVLHQGFESEPHVVAALIGMYCKFEETFDLALLVFERTEFKDIVIWSSMMVSSSRHGDNARTIKLFKRMQIDDIRPNSVTMLAVLTACIGLSSTNHGRGAHGFILKSGLHSDVCVGNSLIDMYAKCGCLSSSVRAFFEMPIKDSISYSSLMSSYGLHGHGYEALRVFHEMQRNGIKPDSIAFLAVLSACKHSGLIDEGDKVFKLMKENCDKAPSLEHYACYVDLLGRCGRLEDAYDEIRKMNKRPDARILTSLVSACRIHGKFEVAERLALWLIDSEPENAANYALLSIVYAESGDWIGKEKIMNKMISRGLMKNSGSSRIEN